jgi:hypothetical protein
VTKTWGKVTTDINNWCSEYTLRTWMESQLDFRIYSQRVLPLLSKAQMAAHVTFSKRLQSRWGLPPRKYLWIHYDEKWFYGFVPRNNAKMCEALGLHREFCYAYHRNHINKVMVLALTACAFDGDVENGGDGVKLGFYRCEAARVALKAVREGRRTKEGKMKFDGEVKRKKGDIYMVDTTVTGTNSGTSDNPTFSLRGVFENSIFPRIAEITGPGGKYEGYIPIQQGDNAGPHQDKDFKDWCISECERRGWHWEPQAAQMPYVNNLDLAVFPSMSKRHSALLKAHSNNVANTDIIFSAAEEVWKNLPSATIARGFVLAFRNTQKVIKYKGSNDFLQDGNLGASIRADFIDTDTGVKPAKYK